MKVIYLPSYQGCLPKELSLQPPGGSLGNTAALPGWKLVSAALRLINHSSNRAESRARADSWHLKWREGHYSKHIFRMLLRGPHTIYSLVIVFFLLRGHRAKAYDIT